jgi:cytochrome P450
VFNIFGNVVFSTDLIDLNEENKDGGIKDVMRLLMETIILPNISDFYPSLSKFDLQSRKKSMWKYINKFRAIWGPIIDARRKRGDFSAQNDFLDVLLHENFTDARIHQMVLELFTAGIDTTSATIEWGMAELVKAPQSMKKVVEELDQEFNKDSVNESRLIQLPYLQACIKETLRLHPAVPLLLHRANESCQVMNYTIPQNTKVFVNLWAVLRDPSTWDEPSRFIPDRFFNSEIGDYKRIDAGYIPFGGGRRICPGSPLALRSVPLFIGALLHSFDWSLPAGKDPLQLDMKESFGLTMKKAQPLLLIPKRRH